MNKQQPTHSGHFDENFSIEEAELKLALEAGAAHRLQWLEEAFEFAVLSGAITSPRLNHTAYNPTNGNN